MFFDSINFAQGATFGMNLYCFMLYCFLLIVSIRGNITNLYVNEKDRFRTTLLYCGILLFALTPFVGDDFFHYHELMSEYRGQVFGDQERGLEAFYQYLIYYIDGDYFLFRLVVWGASLFVVVRAARRYGANIYHTLFVILAGFIVTFSYARATLAMAVFSLGVVMICVINEQKFIKKILTTIIGLITVLCSIYFHRSMFPMVVIAVLWQLLPRKRQLSKYSLWLFPIFVAISAIVLKTAFEELLVVANTMEDESGMLDRAEYYTEQDGVKHNLNGYIRLILHYLTFYFPFIVIANAFRSDRVQQLADRKIIWMYQIMYWIMVFATSFLFLDIETDVLFDRYLYMSFIPMSLLVVSMKDNGALTKGQYLCIVICFVVSNLFQLFAAVYSVS